MGAPNVAGSPLVIPIPISQPAADPSEAPSTGSVGGHVIESASGGASNSPVLSSIGDVSGGWRPQRYETIGRTINVFKVGTADR
ncbi:MAG: hypothetical protein ACYDB2_03650 [Acidimicrobiales bacterium]